MTDLVLLHPFPFDGRYWEGLRPYLPPTVRLHAPDLPGFGANAAPPCETIDAMADFVRGWVDAAGLDRFVLGGLSMGGYVTLAYWRRHPDRRPAALVLADTRAEADTDPARRLRDLTAAQVRVEGTLVPYSERAAPGLVSPDAPPGVMSRALGLICSQRVETVAVTCGALRDRQDERDTLRTIDVPTLVVAGTADVITPVDGMRPMAASIAGAQLVELEGAGHLSSLEQPEPFASALALLG